VLACCPANPIACWDHQDEDPGHFPDAFGANVADLRALPDALREVAGEVASTRRQEGREGVRAVSPVLRVIVSNPLDAAVPIQSSSDHRHSASVSLSFECLMLMVESPCISICQMNPALGLCRGCFRTCDEIATWSSATDHTRLRILAAVAHRRDEHDPWQGDFRCDCER